MPAFAIQAVQLECCAVARCHRAGTGERADLRRAVFVPQKRGTIHQGFRECRAVLDGNTERMPTTIGEKRSIDRDKGVVSHGDSRNTFAPLRPVVLPYRAVAKRRMQMVIFRGVAVDSHDTDNKGAARRGRGRDFLCPHDAGGKRCFGAFGNAKAGWNRGRDGRGNRGGLREERRRTK